MYFPKDDFPSDNFPSDNFPSDNFPSGNFPNVKFPKRKIRLGPLRQRAGSKWAGYDGLEPRAAANKG